MSGRGSAAEQAYEDSNERETGVQDGLDEKFAVIVDGQLPTKTKREGVHRAISPETRCPIRRQRWESRRHRHVEVSQKTITGICHRRAVAGNPSRKTCRERPVTKETTFPVKHPVSLGSYSLISLDELYSALTNKSCCLGSDTNYPNTYQHLRIPIVMAPPTQRLHSPSPISPEIRCVSPSLILAIRNTPRPQPSRSSSDLPVERVTNLVPYALFAESRRMSGEFIGRHE